MPQLKYLVHTQSCFNNLIINNLISEVLPSMHINLITCFHPTLQVMICIDEEERLEFEGIHCEDIGVKTQELF